MFAEQGSKVSSRPLIGYLELHTSEPGTGSGGKPVEERYLVEEIVELAAKRGMAILSNWS
ncbi:hypothetical protein [Bradyrhizobium sp. 6(2017)]|uniref:hypothetical protein n=1 Tax=Bradyrhizobium sp. 6(2017) TaxID=1197460 RepID=UPI002FE55576